MDDQSNELKKAKNEACAFLVRGGLEPEQIYDNVLDKIVYGGNYIPDVKAYEDNPDNIIFANFFK